MIYNNEGLIEAAVLFANPNFKGQIFKGEHYEEETYFTEEAGGLLEKAIEKMDKSKKYTASQIGETNPRQGEIDAVMEESAREAATTELDTNKRPGDGEVNPGGDNR